MTPLTPATSHDDETRATRLVIAWLGGDKLALDVVLAEVRADPTGTPGILFALTDFAARLGNQAADNFGDQLRARLPSIDDGPGGCAGGDAFRAEWARRGLPFVR